MPSAAAHNEQESPLVGRATEFGRLVEVYHAAAQGDPHVVALEGEAGIGKTRLALEFLNWASAQGARVLHGRAFEAGDRVPYQPIVDAFRQSGLGSSLASLPEAVTPFFARLAPPWRAELTRLLPELSGTLPDARLVSGDDAAARTRLLEAVARLTQAMAEPSPLVVFVDDAQWADVASLDVLRYTVRHWRTHDTRAMLLLTLRNESLNSSLVEWLSGIEREAPTTRCLLRALTADDTRQLVEALAAGAPAAESPPAALQSFSEWLFAETGGQPFFIAETLKTLVQRGVLLVLPAATGGWALDFKAAGDAANLRRVAHLPRGVQALIQVRLARLAPAALALLTAGAVLGRDFQFETVCAIAGLDEDEGLAALDELRRGQFVREDGTSVRPLSISITHDKIRDVVYAGAGEARLRVFHRRALEALQAAPTPPGELARHALAAGLSERAFGFSLDAGDDALRVFAVRNAIQYYEQARALAPSLRLAISDLQRLCLPLGRAYELESDFANARAVYETLLASARQAHHPEATCAALNRLATLAAQANMDFESAMAHLREALSIAEQHGDIAGLAETEWNLAQIGYYKSDPHSLSHGERALALARELGRPDLLARSLNGLAWTKTDLTAEWPQAVAHAEEARALYASLGNRAMEADCLCLLANAYVYLGQPRAAANLARAAQAISHEINNPWGQAHSALQMAKCALEAGDYAEALALAQHSAELAQARNIPMLHVLGRSLQGAAQRTLGMVDLARETHQTPAPAFMALLMSFELIADHAAARDWPAAYAEAQRLKTAPLNRTPPYNCLISLDLVAEAFIRAGEVEAAAAFVQRFGEFARDSRRTRVSHLRAAAVLARWRGDPGQAIGQLQEAAALAADIGLPGDLWQINAALSELYRQQGDEAQALAVATRARETLRALAARLDDGRLREAFLAAEPARGLLAEAS
jgi:predicted ATPase